MKRLFAPWRMKFVQSHSKACAFCNVAEQPGGAGNLLVHRGEGAYVLVNRYPYTSGHLLVVANRHCRSLEDLDAGTRAEMIELATKCMHILRKVYAPEAFNLGANIGKAAGAGIAGHVHLHVVPRWGGDTSFMTILAGTRVLPEEPEETCRRVHAAWEDS